jgi:type IV pilus assembly protein PilW
MLIAMALSLLLIIAAMNIFISGKQSYRTEAAMSRNQENGRFAIEFLNRDIRVAGFIGCSNLKDVVPNIIATDPPLAALDLTTTLQGFDGNGKNGTGATWENPSTIHHVYGTDIVVVNRGGDCGADLTTAMGSITEGIQVETNNCGFKRGSLLLVTDCQSADLIRATNFNAGASSITIEHQQNATGNLSPALSKAYAVDATVSGFQQFTYFIGMAPSGNPSLYRSDGSSTDEIVENVEDMQIVYGLDDGTDGEVDSYASASTVTDWSRVLSVKISLLIRSQDNATVQPQTLVFNGSNINAGGGADRRLRNIFSTSIGIRNRLP